MDSSNSLRTPTLLLIALGVVMFVTLLVAGATSSTAFGAYTQTWEGASELQRLGDQTDTSTTLVRDVSAYPANGSGSMAIVLSPSRAYAPADRQRIARFVRSGGTLLVAEDFRPHSNPLLSAIGAQSRFDGRLVRDERHYYESPALPVATNLTSHPLTNESDSLTLNHGTVLEPAGDATVLARTSGYAYVDTNRNAALDDTEELGSYPVVAVESVGAGRVILVSDPSVFINAMLDRAGNQAFARALLMGPERVLIDTTHTAGGLPPLRLLVLVLRETPLLAFAIGGLGVLGVFFWDRGYLPRVRWPRDRTPEQSVSKDTLVVAVLDEHPDWERGRVERVVQALMSENEPAQGDD